MIALRCWIFLVLVVVCTHVKSEMTKSLVRNSELEEKKHAERRDVKKRGKEIRDAFELADEKIKRAEKECSCKDKRKSGAKAENTRQTRSEKIDSPPELEPSGSVFFRETRQDINKNQYPENVEEQYKSSLIPGNYPNNMPPLAYEKAFSHAYNSDPSYYASQYANPSDKENQDRELRIEAKTPVKMSVPAPDPDSLKAKWNFRSLAGSNQNFPAENSYRSVDSNHGFPLRTYYYNRENVGAENYNRLPETTVQRSSGDFSSHNIIKSVPIQLRSPMNNEAAFPNLNMNMSIGHLSEIQPDNFSGDHYLHRESNTLKQKSSHTVGDTSQIKIYSSRDDKINHRAVKFKDDQRDVSEARPVDLEEKREIPVSFDGKRVPDDLIHLNDLYHERKMHDNTSQGQDDKPSQTTSWAKFFDTLPKEKVAETSNLKDRRFIEYPSYMLAKSKNLNSPKAKFTEYNTFNQPRQEIGLRSSPLGREVSAIEMNAPETEQQMIRNIISPTKVKELDPGLLKKRTDFSEYKNNPQHSVEGFSSAEMNSGLYKKNVEAQYGPQQVGRNFSRIISPIEDYDLNPELYKRDDDQYYDKEVGRLVSGPLKTRMESFVNRNSLQQPFQNHISSASYNPGLYNNNMKAQVNQHGSQGDRNPSRTIGSIEGSDVYPKWYKRYVDSQNEDTYSSLVNQNPSNAFQRKEISFREISADSSPQNIVHSEPYRKLRSINKIKQNSVSDQGVRNASGEKKKKSIKKPLDVFETTSKKALSKHLSNKENSEQKKISRQTENSTSLSMKGDIEQLTHKFPPLGGVGKSVSYKFDSEHPQTATLEITHESIKSNKSKREVFPNRVKKSVKKNLSQQFQLKLENSREKPKLSSKLISESSIRRVREPYLKDQQDMQNLEKRDNFKYEYAPLVNSKFTIGNGLFRDSIPKYLIYGPYQVKHVSSRNIPPELSSFLSSKSNVFLLSDQPSKNMPYQKPERGSKMRSLSNVRKNAELLDAEKYLLKAEGDEYSSNDIDDAMNNVADDSIYNISTFTDSSSYDSAITEKSESSIKMRSLSEVRKNAELLNAEKYLLKAVGDEYSSNDIDDAMNNVADDSIYNISTFTDNSSYDSAITEKLPKNEELTLKNASKTEFNQIVENKQYDSQSTAQTALVDNDPTANEANKNIYNSFQTSTPPSNIVYAVVPTSFAGEVQKSSAYLITYPGQNPILGIETEAVQTFMQKPPPVDSDQVEKDVVTTNEFQLPSTMRPKEKGIPETYLKEDKSHKRAKSPSSRKHANPSIAKIKQQLRDLTELEKRKKNDDTTQNSGNVKRLVQSIETELNILARQLPPMSKNAKANSVKQKSISSKQKERKTDEKIDIDTIENELDKLVNNIDLHENKTTRSDIEDLVADASKSDNPKQTPGKSKVANRFSQVPKIENTIGSYKALNSTARVTAENSEVSNSFDETLNPQMSVEGEKMKKFINDEILYPNIHMDNETFESDKIIDKEIAESNKKNNFEPEKLDNISYKIEQTQTVESHTETLKLHNLGISEESRVEVSSEEATNSPESKPPDLKQPKHQESEVKHKSINKTITKEIIEVNRVSPNNQAENILPPEVFSLENSYLEEAKGTAIPDIEDIEDSVGSESMDSEGGGLAEEITQDAEETTQESDYYTDSLEPETDIWTPTYLDVVTSVSKNEKENEHKESEELVDTKFKLKAVKLIKTGEGELMESKEKEVDKMEHKGQYAKEKEGPGKEKLKPTTESNTKLNSLTPEKIKSLLNLLEKEENLANLDNSSQSSMADVRDTEYDNLEDDYIDATKPRSKRTEIGNAYFDSEAGNGKIIDEEGPSSTSKPGDEVSTAEGAPTEKDVEQRSTTSVLNATESTKQSEEVTTKGHAKEYESDIKEFRDKVDKIFSLLKT